MRIETLVAPNPGAFTLDGTRTYVLDGSCVIDPGPAIASHIEAIIELLEHPAQVLLTHRHADHVPAALKLRQRLQMEILGPAGVGVDVDRTLRDGDVIAIGETTLTVIETPGHTAEHVCFLSSSGDLFTGDMVLGEGSTVILPPDGDMGAYLRSLSRLRQLNARTIWPGHGPARDDVQELLDNYIAHRRQREAQVVAAVSSGAVTVLEMRERIYPDVDPRLHGAAESQIEAHLADLVSRSVLRREGTRFLPAIERGR